MTNIINDSRINYDNYILILSLFYIYEMFLGENEDFLEKCNHLWSKIFWRQELIEIL